MHSKSIQLNGFYRGVVTSVQGNEDFINQKRQEWQQDGRICWVIRLEKQHNQQSLDDE